MTGGQPLVSVVTASFNALEGLKRTVASAAAQDFAACEHIVVDGGSSDGTAEWLAAQGGACRWISEPDGGIAAALNKGARMARGEYVLVLQAEDEFFASSSLADAAPYLAGDADIVSFDVLVTGPSRDRIVRSRGLGPKLEFFMALPHQGAFCRRDLFARIGGFDESLRVALDYEWMLRAKRTGATAAVVHQVLSIMPATGVSSRTDAASLRHRLAENRAIQRRHLPGPIRRAVHTLFWLVYPHFKLRRHRPR